MADLRFANHRQHDHFTAKMGPEKTELQKLPGGFATYVPHQGSDLDSVEIQVATWPLANFKRPPPHPPNTLKSWIRHFSLSVSYDSAAAFLHSMICLDKEQSGYWHGNVNHNQHIERGPKMFVKDSQLSTLICTQSIMVDYLKPIRSLGSPSDRKAQLIILVKDLFVFIKL